jgi:hypothetical protein
LAVDIEVESAQGWSKVRLNPKACCIPGGYPIDQGPVRVIAPDTAVDFAFTFDRSDYMLKPGQEARLRIYTWPTEASMRARGPKHGIITSPFAVY